MSAGLLVLVVGPSGAGKDTVLDYARKSLGTSGRVKFCRRVITRPPGPGEDHEPATPAAFAARRFALQWQAHGLQYGIPLEIEVPLAAGQVVVANVSRAVLAQARARYRCLVVEITAPAAILAQRLAARGRESAAEIAERLAREVAVQADVTIVNDRTPAHAGRLFLASLS